MGKFTVTPPIESAISKVSTMADNTIRLQVDLQEQTPELMSTIFGLYNKLGYFVFAEDLDAMADLRFKDLPKVKVEKGDKTPSKRLRDRMYVFWKKTGQGADFETFYKKEMNRIGQHYLDKLDNYKG